MSTSRSAEMTRQDLRVFLQEWFCGCGSPQDACRALLNLLRLHPLYEHYDELEAFLPDDGVQYLMLYTLDHFELTEHGGNVGGAWLTNKGKAVLVALERETGDEFEALTESCCIHGYSVEDGDEPHDCFAAGEPVRWNREGPVL